jgi:hypothetical protein
MAPSVRVSSAPLMPIHRRAEAGVHLRMGRRQHDRRQGCKQAKTHRILGRSFTFR